MMASPENRADPATPSRNAIVRLLPKGALRQRHQREDAALALVVGLHQEQHVFRRDDDQQRPDDERDDADNFRGPSARL